MAAMSVPADGFSVAVTYPDSWSFAPNCVPNLIVPRQLFGLSNRPIQVTPPSMSQPRPMLSTLDSGAMFIWSYYQVPGDPNPDEPDVLPDYGRYSLPLTYDESEVLPAYAAREWSPSQFLWRRIGFVNKNVTVTVWIWEGTSASFDDVQMAKQTVASVRPMN